jgi:hypothetical protein
MILKLSIISLISFILIALDVLFDGLLTQLDYTIFEYTLEYNFKMLDSIMLKITTMGNISSIVIFTLLTVIVLVTVLLLSVTSIVSVVSPRTEDANVV